MPRETPASALRIAYAAELAVAAGARSAGDHELAYRHLARAHILGQRFTWRHVRAHWEMWRLAAATGDWRELIGQSTRILAATLFSRIWVPLGNTGRANVSAFKPMPVPDDLRALLEANR